MLASRVFPNSSFRVSAFKLIKVDPRFERLTITNRPSYKLIKDSIQDVRPIVNENVLKHLTDPFLIAKVKENEQFFYEKLVEVDIDYTKDPSPYLNKKTELNNISLDSRKTTTDYFNFYLSLTNTSN